MGAGSYERKTFDGGVVQTTLAANISDTDTTVTVADGSTFPDGLSGPFVIALGIGTSSEEKMLVSSRSTNTLTISARAYDDTVAASHTAGVTVDHVLDASTIDQANRYANLQSAKGDVVVHDGTNPASVTVGANDTVLAADSTASTGVAWKTVSDVGAATTAYVDGEISTVTSNYQSADATLQSNYEAADTTLQNNIDTEASTRASADTTLSDRITVLESIPYAEVQIAQMTRTSSYTSGNSSTSWGSVSGGAITIVSDPSGLISSVGTRTLTLNNRGNVWIRRMTGGLLSVSSTTGFDYTEWNSAPANFEFLNRTLSIYDFGDATPLSSSIEYQTIDLTNLTSTDFDIVISGNSWLANTGFPGPPSQTLTLTSAVTKVRLYQTSIIP